MQQHSNNGKTALLVGVPALVLMLGVALGFILKGASRRAVGMMPEVVCAAGRSLNIADETAVRAARPLSAGVVAQLSGINK